MSEDGLQIEMIPFADLECQEFETAAIDAVLGTQP
jgi:hypothetical protein